MYWQTRFGFIRNDAGEVLNNARSALEKLTIPIPLEIAFPLACVSLALAHPASVNAAPPTPTVQPTPRAQPPVSSAYAKETVYALMTEFANKPKPLATSPILSTPTVTSAVHVNPTAIATPTAHLPTTTISPQINIEPAVIAGGISAALIGAAATLLVYFRSRRTNKKHGPLQPLEPELMKQNKYVIRLQSVLSSSMTRECELIAYGIANLAYISSFNESGILIDANLNWDQNLTSQQRQFVEQVATGPKMFEKVCLFLKAGNDLTKVDFWGWLYNYVANNSGSELVRSVVTRLNKLDKKVNSIEKKIQLKEQVNGLFTRYENGEINVQQLENELQLLENK